MSDDEDDAMSMVGNGLSTSELGRQAAASIGISTATAIKTIVRETGVKRGAECRQQSLAKRGIDGANRGLNSYIIPRLKNSDKYPKNKRPEHLQDDDVFDSLTIGEVTLQLSMWSQTLATREATAQNEKKASEKKDHKTNTSVKTVKIEAGEDDATSIFHPQHYSMRPPVSGMGKIWESYPTHWPEVYYSTDLSDVGLDNVLGQKQLELLHDRRSKIEIKMFAPSNANIGRGGFKMMSLKAQEDGSTDIANKEDWLSLVSVNELMLSLYNLVAAWSCFWEGDRSMVMLR